MAIFYITDQGATLVKRGSRLVVEKNRTPIHWVHAFRVKQVVLVGHVQLSSAVIQFLLQEGIDTVFLSYHGRYHGRLMSQFGKNIDLRRLQFRKMDDPTFALDMARRCVRGKISNCRILLRRHNQELENETITRTLHQLRSFLRRIDACETTEQLMGVEGAGASAYFGCLSHILKPRDIVFEGRNRRPPRDPVNVLLSLGYTLLANAVQTQVHVTGLDPYLGCLHSTEYGRPSLVLDLMEELRPVLVDALVISLLNKKVIRGVDFYRPEDREAPAFDIGAEAPSRENYPILLTHEGMKRFITHFENRLNRRVLYAPKGQQLTYRDVLLEQVRLLIHHLEGEKLYEPFTMQ